MEEKYYQKLSKAQLISKCKSLENKLKRFTKLHEGNHKINHPDTERFLKASIDLDGVDFTLLSSDQMITSRRFMYYHWMKKNTILSYKNIGKTLDLMQDHSTVIYAIKTHEGYIDNAVKGYADVYQKLCLILHNHEQS